jgi:outer membrane protein assembly factor BamD
MPIAPRRIGFVLTLLLIWALGIAPSVRADLVWDPRTGWRVEGGALAPFLDTPAGHTAKSLMDNARRAEDAGHAGTALSGYKRVYKKYPTSLFAPEALYRSGRIYENRRQYTKAFRNLQRVIAEHPAYPAFTEVLGSEYRIADKLVKGARPLYWGIIPGFKQRDKGLEFLEQIVSNAPYSEYAGISLMNAASGYTRSGDRDAAIDALDRMINNYPQSLLAPDDYLKLGQTHATLVDGPYYDQGATKEAITYFTDFMLLYPSDSGVAAAEKGLDSMKVMLAESKMKIGDFYFYKRDNYTAAKVFYNEAITSYPESPIAARAKLRLADVEAKASGKKVEGQPDAPKKKRFWLF